MLGSCHKRQKPQAQSRKRQSVTAKREKSQTPNVLTAIQENDLLIVKFEVSIQFCYPQIPRLQSLVDQEIDTY